MACAAVAGLAVRVLYITKVGRRVPTIGDARTYHLLARGLAQGRGYIRPDQLALGHHVPTAEFPPLFPWLLSVAARLGADSVQSQKIVMAVIGSFSIVLVGLIAERLAGPAVGVTAALGAAIYLPLVELDSALMPETLTVVLVATAILLVLAGRTSTGSPVWLAAGLTLGLAALARGEVLLLVPLLVLPAAWRSGATRTAGITRTATALAGVVLVVAPWVVRNAIALGHAPVLSNNLGGLVLGANCPATYHDRPGLWLFSCYRRVDVRGLDETERSSAFVHAGVAYATSHLGRVPAIMAIRLGRTWGVWAVNDQINIETFEGRDHFWHTVAHRMYLVALGLAAAGTVIARKRGIRPWPLLATAVLVSIMSLVTYGNQRFRAPAEPAVLILAAVALVQAAGWMRTRVAR